MIQKQLSYTYLHLNQKSGWFAQNKFQFVFKTVLFEPMGLEFIPTSSAWSDQEYNYSPLDGMLFHIKVTPPPLPHSISSGFPNNSPILIYTQK